MERLGKTWSKIKAILELTDYVFSQDELDLDLDNLDLYLEIEDVENGNSIELELDPIKNFIEEYIGLIITDFSTYNEDIEDLKIPLVGSMVTKVDITDNSIEIELSNLSGNRIGIAKMTPTLSGQFAEKSFNDYPSEFSRYRISFYGGESIEYLDRNYDGGLTFYNEASE